MTKEHSKQRSCSSAVHKLQSQNYVSFYNHLKRKQCFSQYEIEGGFAKGFPHILDFSLSFEKHYPLVWKLDLPV